jgi:hypothetical protein
VSPIRRVLGVRGTVNIVLHCARFVSSAALSFDTIVYSELALQPGQGRRVLHASQRAENIKRRVRVAVSLVELVLCAANAFA